MSTTTIRLPEQLKKRLGEAARKAGLTPHALIIQAIAERVDAEEKQGSFIAEAEARYDNLVSTGEAISWPEMRNYLENRRAGKRTRRPRTRKL
ncbi:ribbon-helix-helix protein, CopG family [Pseudohaliea sp.]|uniref:CopG family ribbon-helix-helix protein n=1 Tax=Pseudohaliea sp. TaxID=2740289 RepID=UPI0032EBCF61